MSDTNTQPQNTKTNTDLGDNTPAVGNNERIVFLRGKRTTLRPLMKTDIPTLLRWINDPDIRQFTRGYFPMMEAGEEKWLQRLSESRDSNISLGIELEGRMIGVMGAHHISWIDRMCTTGAIIGEKDCWGKGIGTDAKMALLNYLFNNLGLRKVLSQVYAFNSRSLDYSRHCGYKIEGVQRKQAFARGRFVDLILLGLFKNEWLPFYRAHMRGESLRAVREAIEAKEANRAKVSVMKQRKTIQRKKR